MLCVKIFPVEPDDEARWQAFHLALTRQYARLGAADIQHPGPDASIHLVVAEVFPGRPVAGIRLHANTAYTQTPLQRAVDDPALQRWVVEKKQVRSAEVSGFWADYRPPGAGLGSSVFQAVIAYAEFLGYDELFAFTHQGIASLASSVGLRASPLFEPYVYPNPTYRSVLRHLDFSKHQVYPKMRDRILGMKRSLATRGCLFWLSGAPADFSAFSGREGTPLSVSVRPDSPAFSGMEEAHLVDPTPSSLFSSHRK